MKPHPTATARFDALESKIGQSLAYRNFKNTAATLGHPIETDEDLNVLEMAAAEICGPHSLEELDPTFASHWSASWTRLTVRLCEGKLNWWDTAKEPPAVDVPSEDDGNGYFPDETAPRQKKCICRVPDAGMCHRLRYNLEYEGNEPWGGGNECQCGCHLKNEDELEEWEKDMGRESRPR